jgi:uncharacterized membrane protein YeaQ/YmgE (transglycosylase-associated protein family)
MSLLLAIIIGVIVGGAGSFIFNNGDYPIGSGMAGLAGAVLSVFIGLLISSGRTDSFAISGLGALYALIGALIVTLLFNLLAHGYTDPNDPELK